MTDGSLAATIAFHRNSIDLPFYCVPAAGHSMRAETAQIEKATS
jgi:hypothetical protein